MSEKTKKMTKPLRTTREKSYDWVTSIPEPTNPKSICFPEWVDDEINLVSSSGFSHTGKHKEKSEKSEKNERSEEFYRRFEDAQVLFLPFCLQDMEYDWKRPREVFPDYQFAIYPEDSDSSDLLNSSDHLLGSSFMRSFISSIHNLEHLAQTTNFGQEATTSKYVPNASGHWKPWHHVYGSGKVGAGTVHSPQVNPSGKYSVRLFWMGAWRKVVIDDFLPVDVTGHVLLPSLPIPKKPSSNVQIVGASFGESKPTPKIEKEIPKPTVILWPFLLSKALLKVANLTMRKDEELLDFNIVHCLTGWVLQKLELKGLAPEDVWEICKTHTTLYAWKEAEATKQPSSPTKEKKDKKKALKVSEAPPEYTERSLYLMALCKDMRSLKQSAVQGLSPCWGHEIVIDECRDIPLERPSPDPEYPLWKKFRWMEWAKSKGLIADPVSMDTTRYLRCVSSFRKFTKLTVYKETPSEEKVITQFPLRKSLAILHQKQQQDSAGKVQDNQDKSTKDYQRSEKPRENRFLPEAPAEEKDLWVRFDDLCVQLVSLKIFYKPSCFYYKARVSNLELNAVTETNPKSNEEPWQDVTWPNALEERGNMPLYFFTDSLETKMILVNVSQTGDQERLVPLEDELSEHNFFVEYERLFGGRSKNQEEATATATPKRLKLNRARIHADLKRSNVIFERYRWDTANTGKVRFFLNTYGSSSSVMELEAGRHVFRVWLKSEFSYCITVLADTRFTLGCFEQILEDLGEEPMRTTQFALNISDRFGRLVAGFGTSDFGDCLRDFFRSYLPRNANGDLTKSQREVLHEVFQRSLLQHLQHTQDIISLQNTIDALRTLFLDKNLRIRKQTRPTNQEQFQFQSLQEKIICERAAIKLQSFFKGVQMRKLRSRHQSGNDRFKEIHDTLQKIYAENFSLEKRDECLGNVIRTFFKNDKASEFLSFYDVSGDFEWDLAIQTHAGSSELTRDYVVLNRYVLRCREEVVLSIHLFCNLSNFALRIIDNDDGVEAYRFTNHVFPGVFKRNAFGYTVIGFAWHRDVKLIGWRLAAVSARTSGGLFDLEEVRTATTTAFDPYVPVCRGLIGRHSIFVRENAILTCRFSCSYEDVRFKARLSGPDREAILEAEGKEKIVLPSVLLRFAPSGGEATTPLPKSRSSRSLVAPKATGRSAKTERKSAERPISKKESVSARKAKDMNFEMASVSEYEAQVYSLEFYVVDNSWPLTKNEWETVRRLREETYFINTYANKDAELFIKESGSKSTLKPSKDTRKSMLKKVQSIEKPWYLLQYSFKANAQVALIKDKTEEDKVFNLKKSWYQTDRDRQNYLKKYTDPGCECPEEYTYNTPAVSQSKMTEMSAETVEDEENAERTTKCPRWTEANVPPFDLSPYYRPQCPCPIEFRRKIVKTQEDHIADQEERRKMIEEYNASLAKKKHDMELWINESNERRTLVFLWYADCRKASERVFQENYTMRQNFFDKWTAELTPQKKQEKRGSGKTAKK